MHSATIDLASIDTGSEPRDNYLRSADYFEVEKYPTMSYRSAGIRRTDDGWVIDGELTLHGVTSAFRWTAVASRSATRCRSASRSRPSSRSDPPRTGSAPAAKSPL